VTPDLRSYTPRIMRRCCGCTFLDHIGQKRDPGAENVGQPGSLNCDLAGLGDHPGISDHGHVGQPVGRLEGVDDRRWRLLGALSPVPTRRVRL
jgi:hypothetical protein